MTMQLLAVGRSVLGSPFVIEDCRQTQAWLLDCAADVLAAWVGDPADDVSVVEYLHERDALDWIVLWPDVEGIKESDFDWPQQ